MQRFRDSEELSLALKHTNVSAMQVSRGAFQATWLQQCVADWSLQYLSFEEGCSVCSGDAPSERLAVVVPLKRAPGFRLLGRDVSPRTVSVYAPASEHSDATTAGCSEVVIVAPPNFATICHAEGCELPRTGSKVVEGSVTGIEALRCLLVRMPIALRELEQSGASAENYHALSDAMARTLADALKSDASREAAAGRPKMPRGAILRQLEALIEASNGEPLYAGELAHAVGISQASLQRVFHEWFGMPPARYLTLRRLYIARNRLRVGRGETVTSIASALGFWDFSRFSKVYRLLFGELPSETLRNGRAVRNIASVP